MAVISRSCVYLADFGTIRTIRLVLHMYAHTHTYSVLRTWPRVQSWWAILEPYRAVGFCALARFSVCHRHLMTTRSDMSVGRLQTGGVPWSSSEGLISLFVSCNASQSVSQRRQTNHHNQCNAATLARPGRSYF